MGKKMYYSEQEAADRLGVPAGELAAFIRDDRLRVFQDGPRRMFRVDEVEGLVSLAATQRRPEEEIVDLAPADSANLSEAEAAAPPTKEDTVITAEGISIFDDEDLEIETADPMAKTQIAPSIEDQVAMEGVGSGSGLLDLTRESDDTSLGAEVLDHIDLEPPPMAASAAGASAVAAPPISAAAAAETPIIMPTYVEAIDPGGGCSGGSSSAARSWPPSWPWPRWATSAPSPRTMWRP